MRNIQINKTKLSSYYKYDWGYGADGHLVLRGKNENQWIANKIGGELNILSKWLWGTGMAANSIYNAHGFSVKFQGPKEINYRRAKLLAKIWRFCRSNNFHISGKPFPRWYSDNGRYKFRETIPDYNEIVNQIKEIF